MKNTFGKNLLRAARNPVGAVLTLYIRFSARRPDKRLGLFEKLILNVCANVLLPFTKESGMRIEYLRYLQSCGLSALPDRYFEPVPRVDDVDRATVTPVLIADDPGETPDMREVSELLNTPAQVREFENRCLSMIAGNRMFGAADAFAYSHFIKKYRPRHIVEIGSGYSAQVALWASADCNLDNEVISIEPFPSDFLLELNRKEARHTLVRQRIQDYHYAKNDIFSKLRENDILFIDSTHVCSIGGDLPAIFCHILPRLHPGVLVHVHDVSWPYEYPRSLVFKSGRFYNELYLLTTLLNHGNYEYLFGTYHLLMKKGIWLAPTNDFPHASGGSLWMRKRSLHK
ncbi:MAG: class I SAM-dependent methyltransferase [Gammaproteobacteria bacterium]|nr:class I SAM-dependent methyltransferase [Gammaproteobacteria bacterium]MBU1481674.1 class I SAM-dependent methyltransferase [Gammaproteobacteria bacterium]